MTGRLRRALDLVVVGALAFGTLSTVAAAPAHAAYAVPATPSGLTSSIEDLQPYIGQSTCDPVAKPGVTAFKNLLLATYTDSGSLGIVRDCGSGGQSEHKEGRAFDWKMSAYNSRQAGEVSAALSWLLKTDEYGNKYAMARRFGIMYMIWNKQIWKAYNPDAGWQPYSGDSAHTDHVHFSFGWNGAKKVTSYWDKTVAPVDFGMSSPPHVTPVRRFENLAIVRQYGGLTLKSGSQGTAVKIVQKALLVKDVDGDFGSITGAHVAKFQYDQKLSITQRFGPTEWKLLFPPPANPFGALDKPLYAFGNAIVRGWAIDGETKDPVQANAYVDGQKVGTVTSGSYRDDVAAKFPEFGAWHGFDFPLPLLEGSHEICVIALNAAGTTGYNTKLGCVTVETAHNPVGALEAVSSSLGVVRVAGWALDPDGTDPLTTSLTVDGGAVDLAMTTADREDIGNLFPGAGNDHGVTAELALPEGTHKVCLVAANLAATPGIDSALGCQDVTVHHTPVGTLDAVRRAPSGVQVWGWALDPDVADAVQVQLTSDGTAVRTLTASATRTSLATAWPEQGAAHAFSTTLDLPVGTHTVCAVALNAPGTDGDNTLPLGCKPVTVTHDAVAADQVVRTAPGGTVLVRGAAYDADTLDPVSVQVYVDKALRTTLTATAATAGRWPGYGTARGYQTSVGSLSSGWHTVCVRALNAAGTTGSSTPLRCTSLVVHSPVGQITSARVSGRYVTVSGWALDPDTTTGTSVRLYVDGVWRATVSAKAYRSGLLTLMPGYGSYHGFSKTLAVSSGTHKVCATGVNVSGTSGTARTVACATVRVS